jgi:transcription elongation factor Elf1
MSHFFSQVSTTYKEFFSTLVTDGGRFPICSGKKYEKRRIQACGVCGLRVSPSAVATIC